MDIRCDCSACRTQFRVNATSAGRTGKCPNCGAAIIVPAPYAAALVLIAAMMGLVVLTGPTGAVADNNGQRTIGTLAKTLAERGDPTAVFPAQVTVDLPKP